jgi:thymidylate synthase (FAD)
MIQKGLLDKAVHAYTTALNMGIAKEQARALLPEGLTGTTLYMSGTLRSWIHYCELRMANGTQKEHMDIAKRCWSVIGTHFPDVIKAVEEL